MFEKREKNLTLLKTVKTENFKRRNETKIKNDHKKRNYQ